MNDNILFWVIPLKVEADDTLTLKEVSLERNRGRPRLYRAREISNIALHISGSLPDLHHYLRHYQYSPQDWPTAIDS